MQQCKPNKSNQSGRKYVRKTKLPSYLTTKLRPSVTAALKLGQKFLPAWEDQVRCGIIRPAD